MPAAPTAAATSSGSLIMPQPAAATLPFAPGAPPAGRLRVTVTPSPLAVDRTVTLTVAAFDADSGATINNANVVLNNTVTGVTGTAFSYRFSRVVDSWFNPETGQIEKTYLPLNVRGVVTAGGYSDATIPFTYDMPDTP
jgi:hypothetical protein